MKTDWQAREQQLGAEIAETFRQGRIYPNWSAERTRLLARRERLCVQLLLIHRHLTGYWRNMYA